MDGNKSCLKEILTEIRYQIIATLRYQGTETKILFPEYYADAVENTRRGSWRRIIMVPVESTGSAFTGGTGLWKIRPAVCTF